MPRIGLLLNDTQMDRLRVVTEANNATQSEVLAAVTSVMPESELARVIERYRKLKELEKELRAAADQKLLSMIRSLSATEIETMIAAAKRAE